MEVVRPQTYHTQTYGQLSDRIEAAVLIAADVALFFVPFVSQDANYFLFCFFACPT